ncbi:MAG TPA: EamA family transporter [Verrucomicrobiae bacterium]
MSARAGRIPQWFLWAVLAVVCWGLWAITSKLIGDALSAGQSQAVSTLGILPVLWFLERYSKPERRHSEAKEKLRKGRVPAIAAGLAVCVGNVAYYHALKIGGKAATVVSVTALYPLVTVLLAILILREKFNLVQMIGIALSLVSIAIFNIASAEGVLTGWLAYALVPVVLWGVGGLLQKISTNCVSGEASTFWFLLAFIPVSVALLAWEPLRVMPSGRTWALVMALGSLFGLGNLAILFAFARDGKASIIAPLAGLYPVVSIPVAILFLGERVTAKEWIAIALALVAVVALAFEGKKTNEETN